MSAHKYDKKRRTLVPSFPGHYWARWKIKDPGTAEEDDPPGGQWEVVQVFANCIDPEDDEYLMVAVPGVERSQSVENFHWGTRVPEPREATPNEN
jgi:hypothetical protein